MIRDFIFYFIETKPVSVSCNAFEIHFTSFSSIFLVDIFMRVGWQRDSLTFQTPWECSSGILYGQKNLPECMLSCDHLLTDSLHELGLNQCVFMQRCKFCFKRRS